MGVIKRILSFLFGFNGKIGRLHFAIALLLVIVFQLFIVFASTIVVTVLKSPAAQKNPDEVFIVCIFLIISISIIYLFKYSHVIRRISDLDQKLNQSTLSKLSICFDLFVIPGLLSGANGLVICPILSFIFLIPLMFIKGIKNEIELSKESSN